MCRYRCLEGRAGCSGPDCWKAERRGEVCRRNWRRSSRPCASARPNAPAGPSSASGNIYLATFIGSTATLGRMTDYSYHHKMFSDENASTLLVQVGAGLRFARGTASTAPLRVSGLPCGRGRSRHTKAVPVTSPSPHGLAGASVSHHEVITARADLLTASPGPASRQSPGTTRPVVDQPSGVSTQHCPIDAGEAFALLRRWSQDRGSPSHLRELGTHYRNWPAVALVLGELTAAELRQPGRAAG